MVDIERLKKAKKEKKITFDELSEISKVPVSTLYDIFRGVTVAPRIDTMQAIERALGISDGWTAEDRAAGVVDKLSVPISADEDEIITLLREIEETKGAAARELVQKVVVSMLEGTLK